MRDLALSLIDTIPAGALPWAVAGLAVRFAIGRMSRRFWR